MKMVNDRRIYRRGGAVVLLGLLYFGVYLFVRNHGDIVHIENRGSETGRTIQAHLPEWIEIQIGLAEEAGSVPLAFSARMAKARPWILNAVFWPLRKLEALIYNSGLV